MHKYLSLLLFVGLTLGQRQYDIKYIVKQGDVCKKKFSDEIANGTVFKMISDNNR